jgi:predicted nucleic acid-binding protein
MLVYLDNCCFNRPFDEQSNLLVRLETEAKTLIQTKIKDKQIELVWSEMLDYENNDNPFWERKTRIADWKLLSLITVNVDDNIMEKVKLFVSYGLKSKDAIHIACAVYANADFFITTDNGILKKPIKEIEIINPIDFVRKEFI